MLMQCSSEIFYALYKFPVRFRLAQKCIILLPYPFTFWWNNTLNAHSVFSSQGEAIALFFLLSSVEECKQVINGCLDIQTEGFEEAFLMHVILALFHVFTKK